MYAHCFAHGNILARQAVALYEEIKAVVGFAPVPHALRYAERAVELPSQAALAAPLVFAVPACNADDKNSYVEVFFQMGVETFELRTMIEVLAHVWMRVNSEFILCLYLPLPISCL